MRPQPGLAGDGAADAEARQAAEQREQAVLVPHVLPGPHRQPFLGQRPPHGLTVHGEALRVPRPILQRPVLADLLGHGGDGPVQLLAGHDGGRGHRAERNRAAHRHPLLPPLPEAVPGPAEVAPPVPRHSRSVPRGPAARGGCSQAAAPRCGADPPVPASPARPDGSVCWAALGGAGLGC